MGGVMSSLNERSVCFLSEPTGGEEKGEEKKANQSVLYKSVLCVMLADWNLNLLRLRSLTVHIIILFHFSM